MLISNSSAAVLRLILPVESALRSRGSISWKQPGLIAKRVEAGFWQTHPARLPVGRHSYKLVLDGNLWMDDPANPKKTPDGLGGLNSVVDVCSEEMLR